MKHLMNIYYNLLFLLYNNLLNIFQNHLFYQKLMLYHKNHPLHNQNDLLKYLLHLNNHLIVLNDIFYNLQRIDFDNHYFLFYQNQPYMNEHLNQKLLEPLSIIHLIFLYNHSNQYLAQL